LTKCDYLYCRFTGSDIVVVVRDASMEPVREVQAATHFRKVSNNYLIQDNSN
jgi:SpoVK/Ycf46/Vps4 family AAA+-type ATPase